MSTAPVLLQRPSPNRRDRALRVVILDEELPYPLTSGKRIRTMGLLQRLAPRHRLTYVCHRNADPDEGKRAEAHFAELGIRTVVVDRAVPPRSGPGFYYRLARNLLSPLPYSVQTHTSPEMQRAVRELAASEPIDLWHCEWSPYAQALGNLPGRRVVMAHNVESVIWQRYHETETNPLKRWYIRQQWRKFKAFERRALSAAELTIAVSDLDADRFRDELGVPSVAVVDNGVDTDFFTPPAQPYQRESATLLFLGSLEWRPNLDAVKQLLDHIFPAVRAQMPAARLLLVGRNPPDWVKAASSAARGIEVHASVPDVRPYLHRAGMLVVPLRVGGGSRLKILEALATATPVVSTRVGAEGLHLEADRHLLLSETPTDMVPAIVDAIRRPDRLRGLTEAGRKQVLRLYDWGVLADRLDLLWKSVAETTEEGGLRS